MLGHLEVFTYPVVCISVQCIHLQGQLEKVQHPHSVPSYIDKSNVQAKQRFGPDNWNARGQVKLGKGCKAHEGQHENSETLVDEVDISEISVRCEEEFLERRLNFLFKNLSTKEAGVKENWPTHSLSFNFFNLVIHTHINKLNTIFITRQYFLIRMT